MAKVWIPAPLRKFTNGADEVAAAGATVAEIIDHLDRNYSGLKAVLCEKDGKVRRFVNIYVNNADIRFMQDLNTPIGDDDELSIVPAVAGGAFKDVLAGPQ